MVGPDLFFLPVVGLVWLVVLGLLLLGLYWAVRLAIRHERERERRVGGGRPPGPGSAGGPPAAT
ncbi:hypothetical protein [Aquipuribacter sp. SD81]|uniref:hypothetical protein n=1 Tax=Aquipuribacter sp. SD81 TaxID=3127703 RepID=UPI0030197A71